MNFMRCLKVWKKILMRQKIRFIWNTHMGTKNYLQSFIWLMTPQKGAIQQSWSGYKRSNFKIFEDLTFWKLDHLKIGPFENWTFWKLTFWKLDLLKIRPFENLPFENWTFWKFDILKIGTFKNRPLKIGSFENWTFWILDLLKNLFFELCLLKLHIL